MPSMRYYFIKNVVCELISLGMVISLSYFLHWKSNGQFLRLPFDMLINDEKNPVMFPPVVWCESRLVSITGASKLRYHFCGLPLYWCHEASFFTIWIFYLFSILSSTMSILLILPTMLSKKIRWYFI
jgi:hypothetical protein